MKSDTSGWATHSRPSTSCRFHTKPGSSRQIRYPRALVGRLHGNESIVQSVRPLKGEETIEANGLLRSLGDFPTRPLRTRRRPRKRGADLRHAFIRRSSARRSEFAISAQLHRLHRHACCTVTEVSKREGGCYFILRPPLLYGLPKTKSSYDEAIEPRLLFYMISHNSLLQDDYTI